MPVVNGIKKKEKNYVWAQVLQIKKKKYIYSIECGKIPKIFNIFPMWFGVI